MSTELPPPPKPSPDAATNPRVALEDLLVRATWCSQMSAHYESESRKLQGMRARRVAVIKDQAEYAEDTRVTVSMTAEDIAYAWSGNDPKLAEYSAGMVIVERRATMYASMATELRLMAQIHMQVYPHTWQIPTA